MNTNRLEDHIDEPIKKSVVGLSLLGFKTLFSCCGFSYIGEKVTKSHLEKAYIYIDMRAACGWEKGRLVDIAIESGWVISPTTNQIVDFYGPRVSDNDPRHPWNDKESPHYPEKFVLDIHRLNKVLEMRKDHFRQEVEIIDGNYIYKEESGIRHWQYPACKSWKVTPAIFESL